MQRSGKIGRLAGIDLYIHWSFYLLLGWVALAHLLAGDGLLTALTEVLFIGLLFGIVVLHELGHALAARRFGIGTRDITLLPIGGVAHLERIPEEPRKELVIALAGPAVNLALALLLLPAVVSIRGWQSLDTVSMLDGDFLIRLWWVNLGLILFNLLPAFPLDGGRVLRALLAYRFEYVRATQLAAGIGQVLAVLLGLLGLLSGNLLLILVAVFIGLAAAAEGSTVQMRAALGSLPASAAMITHFCTLKPEDSVGQAVELLLNGSQQDFPVVQEPGRVGLLTRQDLFAALAKGDSDGPIAPHVRTEVPSVTPLEMLDRVVGHMQSSGLHTLPVLWRGRLIGMVTDDNLAELLMIRKAIGDAGSTEGLRRAKTTR